MVAEIIAGKFFKNLKKILEFLKFFSSTFRHKLIAELEATAPFQRRPVGCGGGGHKEQACPGLHAAHRLRPLGAANSLACVLTTVPVCVVGKMALKLGI
jgi:hypothetical protein